MKAKNNNLPQSTVKYDLSLPTGELITHINNQSALNVRKAKSVTDIIKSDTTQISSLKRQTSEETVRDLITIQFIQFFEAINLHEKPNDMQIDILVDIILSDFWTLSMTEISYVLRNALKGRYGKIKYAVNIPDVVDWFEHYKEERIGEFMKANERRSQAVKKDKEVVQVDGKSVLMEKQTINPELTKKLLETFKRGKKESLRGPEFIDTENNERLKAQKEVLNFKHGK